MEELIARFVQEQGWVADVIQVSFLAAGEYHTNYLVHGTDSRTVFRINCGSQLGLGDQIGYEFGVLRCLEHSGVTPRPLRVHRDRELFGGGVLLMEFLPGRHLEYATDLSAAAAIFAAVHRQPTCPELIRQDDPVAAIAAESLNLLRRYPDHPLAMERDQLLAYHDEILELGRRHGTALASEPPCVVNTEVNSGNFLIHADRHSLVDWEKAVVSCRYQDLGHFLAPTTTLWRTETVLDRATQTAFLDIYRKLLPQAPPRSDLQQRTLLMEQVIVLRGLCWCFMAHYEYNRVDRSLTSDLTRTKIARYLGAIPELIALVRP